MQGNVHELKPARKPVPRRVRLTEQTIAKIKEGEKVYDLGGPPGFFCIGLRDGVSFRVLADVPTHARRWGLPLKTMERAIGRSRDGLSAKRARTIAAEFIGQIKAGVDPSPKSAAPSPGGATLEQIYRTYVDGYLAKQGASKGTLRTYGYNWARVPGKWHSRPIGEMIKDVAGLQKLHADIRKVVARKTKHPTPTSGQNSADATLKLLAILAGYARGQNPDLPAWITRAVDKFGSRSRDDQGLGLTDLGAWWHGVKTITNETKQWLGLFMLATGLRETDSITARTNNFDEIARTLFVPAPKGHRAGRRDRSFTLPLSDVAVTAIMRARALQREPSDLLFPGPSGSSFAGSTLQRGSNRFADGHKLRHSFATCLEDLGVDEPTRARLLNHKPKTETAKYSNPHKIVAPLRAAVDLLGEAIAKQVEL
jgi:integrase